jgi:hypothetical protein
VTGDANWIQKEKTSMHARVRGLVLAIALTASAGLAIAGEATVLWAREGCEMALVEKSGPEYGVVLRLSEGRVEAGDKFEGDFESINQIRKMKNLSSEDEIMMRGVRYSSSRKYVLQVMPKWCKAPKE